MRRTVVLGLTLLFCGCATTRSARLYDLDSAGILVATFLDSGSGGGPVWIGSTRETADCEGEFVTVPQGSTGWGTIFAGGTAAYALTTTTEDAQRGRAVVSCKDRVVIECEYVTSATSGKGHGGCRDNKSRRYRLMF